MFIFNDKSMRVRLAKDKYTYIYESQSTFMLTNWTNVVYFSSSTFSFVYTQNSSTVSSYCSTFVDKQVLTSCINSMSCLITNCLNCNFLQSQCLTCVNGYSWVNGSCSAIVLCTVQNCQLCGTSNVCSTCVTGYTLDAINNSCFVNITTANNSLPQQQTSNTTNQTQILNTTTNTTNDTTNNSTDNTTMLNETTTNTTDNSTSPLPINNDTSLNTNSTPPQNNIPPPQN